MAFIDIYSTPGLGSGAGPLNILYNPANTSGGMASLFCNNPSLLTNPRRGRRHWHYRAALDAAFSEGAKVFQGAWAVAEEDEAVGQSAIPLRQSRPATGGMLQGIALVFPRGQALERFFAAGREQARPE
jgi:hypothetical protein